MPEPAIVLSSRDFRHAVELASRATERRATIPILSMVRCRANGAFEAAATDLDLTITAKVDREGTGEAAFMLPEARSITRSVAAAGGAKIALVAEAGKIGISSEQLQIEVKHAPHADDFPTGNEVADAIFSATLSHAQLRQLARIVASISTEETRYYLNGVYFHQLDEHTFGAVATDGHQLSMVDMALPDASGSLSGIIIPRKTIRILLGMIGRKAPADDQGIGIRVGSGVRRNADETLAPEKVSAVRAEFHLGVGSAHVGIATKLIDGTFPDYRRVIPSEPPISLLFKSDELRRAVQAVSYNVKEVRAVKLRFERSQVAVSAHYLASGISPSVTIGCDHDWNCGGDLGINGSYLLSMIEAAAGEELLIRTSDPSSPMLIQNPADTGWTGVLMPMRV